MIIKEVRSRLVKIPLEKPIAISNLIIKERDFVFVEIETEDGTKGYGYGFSRGGSISECILNNLRPLLIGRDALLSEALWEEMFLKTRYLGRKGMMMRAISAVDIALWDIKGKKAQLPLWRLLGGASKKVPAYVAGGYFRDGEDIAELKDEFLRYRDQGFQGAKMNMGIKSTEHDLKRVETVRTVIGSQMELMVDFNGVLKTEKQALKIADRLVPYDISFIEEPFLMEHLSVMRQFRQETRIPVAIGEDESGRWAFKELIAQETLDIVRHDATIVGGISEWIKVAHLAMAYDRPIFPHWFPEIHIHLAAAYTGCMGIELIDPQANIMNFYQLVHNPIIQKDGYADAPEEPGLGLQWNWDTLEKFTCKST